MNDFLKELSLQAGGSHYPTVNPHLQQQFAELIVKECCQMMLDLEATYPANLTVREIKKRFGIEQ